jgi:nitrite reductase (NAD(P)H)
VEAGRHRSSPSQAIQAVRQHCESRRILLIDSTGPDRLPFAEQDERRLAIEPITERGQQRPADWPKAFPPVKFELKDIVTPREEWKWIPLASVDDLQPSENNTTSAAVRYGEDSQLAIFHVPKRGYFATQQMCPHKRAFVLEHGIIGDDGESSPESPRLGERFPASLTRPSITANGRLYVSCPLHKRNFSLDDGDCTNDDEYKILAFEAKEEQGAIFLRLPPGDQLDALIGSAKWMVRQADARVMGAIPATKLEDSKETSIEIIGPSAEVDEDKSVAGTDCESGESHKGCGGALEW